MREKSRYQLPRGLILDSTVPELAPHIVISPPSDTPFEVYCPCGSCDRNWPYTPPQHEFSLVVPQACWNTPASAAVEEQELFTQAQEAESMECSAKLNNHVPYDAKSPPRVFNIQRFQYLVSTLIQQLS